MKTISNKRQNTILFIYEDMITQVYNDSKSEAYENHLRGQCFDDIDELIDYAMKGRL